MADDEALARARQAVEDAGATRIRVEIPDTDGNLRGKVVSAAKALKGGASKTSSRRDRV